MQNLHIVDPSRRQEPKKRLQVKKVHKVCAIFAIMSTITMSYTELLIGALGLVFELRVQIGDCAQHRICIWEFAIVNGITIVNGIMIVSGIVIEALYRIFV